MYNNPAFAKGLLNIGNALMGDPVSEARTQAAINTSRRAAAAAQLDEQTADARSQLVQAMLDGDGVRAHAMAAGAGNDFTRDFTTVYGGMLGLPGSEVSEADLSKYLVGGGVQKAHDTFTGMARDNAAAMARQRVSSGASIRAAQIRAEASERIAAQQRAAAQEAAAAKLIEVVSPDGQTIYHPQGDAAGMVAPSTLSEQQSNVLGQIAPILMEGGEVAPALIDITGGSAPSGSSEPGDPLTSNVRLSLQQALAPYIEDGAPNLYGDALGELSRRIASGENAGLVIQDIVNRIEQPTVGQEWFDGEWEGPGQYQLAQPLSGPAGQNVTPQTDAQLQDARAAIAAGANPEAVANRLREMGIDPGLL